jgi:hypothetical protein
MEVYQIINILIHNKLWQCWTITTGKSDVKQDILGLYIQQVWLLKFCEMFYLGPFESTVSLDNSWMFYAF